MNRYNCSVATKFLITKTSAVNGLQLFFSTTSRHAYPIAKLARSLPGNPTYNLTDFSTSEVLDNHISVFFSFWIQTNNVDLDLPYIYWIPQIKKDPYKHRSISDSSKCSTKPLSILLTKLLTHIKQGLQKYCDTAYSRSGINQMWIFKNSREL